MHTITWNGVNGSSLSFMGPCIRPRFRSTKFLEYNLVFRVHKSVITQLLHADDSLNGTFTAFQRKEGEDDD